MSEARPALLPQLAPSPALQRTAQGRRATVALFALLVLALTAAACGPASPPEVPAAADGVPDPVLVEGRTIYSRRCAGCHGTSGGGGRGPQLGEGRVLESHPDIEDQIQLVTNGRDGMPAFEGTLSEAQIEAVVRYTREVLAEA